jgi:ABC-type antimicrobial peptide transport system permease subunit
MGLADTLGIEKIAKIAWWHPLLLLLVGTMVSVVSGLFPAISASRKDPAKILRSDV